MALNYFCTTVVGVFGYGRIFKIFREVAMVEAMRIRAVEKEGLVNLKVLMKHEMESGQRKDMNGKLVAAWFISQVDVVVKGKVMFTGHLGPAVSKDPFLNIKLKGLGKGDAIEIQWTDNRGMKRLDQTTVV